MKNNPLFDDAIKLFNSGVGFMAELREQIMQDMKERIDQKINGLDLAKRSDVDRLETMVKDLQAEVASLKAKPAAKPKAKE